MSGACDAGSGSVRRLRSWLRHERMTVRTELTAFKGAGPETHDAPRSRRRSTPRGKPSCSRSLRKSSGVRGDVLAQERVQRHTVEHLTDLVRFAPLVQVLDAPALLLWNTWSTGSCRGRPCDQQLEFQQSKLVIMDGASLQFIDRVLGIPVACRDRYAQCTLCRFVEISQVQLSNKEWLQFD